MSPCEEKPYKCKQCNYSSTTSSDIKQHKTKNHGQKSYTCIQCNYSSIRAGRLRDHAMTHTGEKPHKCDQCNYSAIASNEVKKHKMIHSVEKPYKCRQCNYAATNAVRLRHHTMTHIGGKEHKCNQCNYSSITSGDMNKHKRTHSGEKPYKCNVTSVNIHQPRQAIWRHTRSPIQKKGPTNAYLVLIPATISTVFRSTLGVPTLVKSHTSATNVSKVSFHWVSSINTLWHTVEKGNTNVTIHQLHQLMWRLTRRGPTPERGFTHVTSVNIILPYPVIWRGTEKLILEKDSNKNTNLLLKIYISLWFWIKLT